MAYTPVTIQQLGATLAGPPQNTDVSANHKTAIEDLRTTIGDLGSDTVQSRLNGKLQTSTWKTYTPGLTGISVGVGGGAFGEYYGLDDNLLFFKAQVNFGSNSGFAAIPVRLGLPVPATGVYVGAAHYLTQGNPGHRAGIWSTWADAQNDSVQMTFDGVPNIPNQLGSGYPEQPVQGDFLFISGFYRPNWDA